MAATPEEIAALTRAKERLDRLDFYPRPVRIDHVRILHVPWLFRLPWFRRFHGYEMGPLILIRKPLARGLGRPDHRTSSATSGRTSTDRLRLWTSYLHQGYRNNPHEIEARRAVAETR